MQIPLNLRFEVNDAHIRVVRQESRTSRDGGKPASPKLLRRVKPNGKRGRFLAWFVERPNGARIDECMQQFGMTRANVFAYWTMIHRDHGVGYVFRNDTITAVLPEGVTADNLFQV